MICTINYQKGCNVCYHRKIFEEIYANLSLKVPIFVFYIYLLKSWVPPLSLKIFPPFCFPLLQNFFSSPPLPFEIFKIWVTLCNFGVTETKIL